MTCHCGRRAEADYAGQPLCDWHSSDLIIWALELLADPETHPRTYAGSTYLSHLDFARHYVMPAVASFLSDGNRCMVINGNNEICFGSAKHCSIELPPYKVNGIFQVGSERLAMCGWHYHLWLDGQGLGDAMLPEQRMVWAARAQIARWQEERERDGVLAPPMTAEQLFTIWPWVVREAKQRELLSDQLHWLLDDLDFALIDVETVELVFPHRTYKTTCKAAAEEVANLLYEARGDVVDIKWRKHEPPQHLREAATRSRKVERESYIVYRLYDADGVLLYVGQTVAGWTKRLRDHHREAVADPEKMQWWSQVAMTRLQECASQEEMDEVEDRAIKQENPLHNKAGKPKELVSA